MTELHIEDPKEYGWRTVDDRGRVSVGYEHRNKEVEIVVVRTRDADDESEADESETDEATTSND